MAPYLDEARGLKCRNTSAKAGDLVRYDGDETVPRGTEGLVTSVEDNVDGHRYLYVQWRWDGVVSRVMRDDDPVSTVARSGVRG